MQNLAIFLQQLLSKNILTMLIIVLSLLMLPTTSNAGVVEEVFVKDRNLLAVTRYSNLKTMDSEAQNMLLEINPDTPTTNPILAHLSNSILVESIGDIDANNWAEALYFSQPQEKNNDWVYIFHILSAEKYVGALLGTGNIRQEQTIDGITRYRRTDDLDSEVYYLAYTDNNLAIMSKNSSSVAKALNLYKEAEVNKSGLIPDADSNYNMIIHLNRYFLAHSRVLPNFLTMLHNDILRDLAGTTAKSDNILNLLLTYFESTLKSLINEVAVLDLKVDITGNNIEVRTKVDIQYGGSLHYALSAFQGNEKSLSTLIPAESIMLSKVELWPEEYIQILEGAGNLGIALISEAIDSTTSKKANNILATFQEAAPVSSQQGILTPESEDNRFGPVSVSVITFSDSSKLPTLFDQCSSLISTGDYSEFLAEKGIKINLSTTTTGTTSANTKINETELFMRSTYFTLPDAFITKQYILSTIIDNNLITVIPLAPLTQNQYYDTKDFCLQALEKTIKSAQNSNTSKLSELATTANEYSSENSIFSLTLNPLRYIQVAMQSEATWPSASPPNRLPIPWVEFSQFFNSKEANTPPMNITINSNRTSVSINMTIPKATLSSLTQALLTLTPGGGF